MLGEISVMKDGLPTTLPPQESMVRIPAGAVVLDGDLVIPEGATGLVVFAHGSGSSRRSPRNRQVAEVLQRRGLATLLFDLLVPHEAAADAETGELRFNIPFLAGRLAMVTRWVRENEATRHLGIGYFGASTGAAAAMLAAADIPAVQAIVSRGGRTDLADAVAPQLKAATLMLVGSLDHPLISWNHGTYQLLHGVKHLVFIPGAGHLFSEPGTLEQVAELAAGWFVRHLKADPTPTI
jgi:dienelactone hydrolase